MNQLLLRDSPASMEALCGLCGQPAVFSAGSQLVLADSSQPVCQACGQRHAPVLAALMQLADEAKRIGRIGRHTVFPPYTALLDLARAADNYACQCSPAGNSSE
jgi:hypothetical protein